MLVEKGVIKDILEGPQIPANAVVVDCNGKHITPGIIDCHSHIATDGGVNESTQSDHRGSPHRRLHQPDDINIYRQLAGGVTSSNILHGSANPIGGQNQVIKLRWGALPEEMKFAEAPPGIKFALGENVKQSNWGDELHDAVSADAHGRRADRPRSLSRRPRVPAAPGAVRGDKEGRSRRASTWSSKRSPRSCTASAGSTATATGRTRSSRCSARSRSSACTIGTLQHILEGYKVADAMAKHGAGGSAFSDWWAYKFEVYDAIPYDGALMHQNGVVVSFNSDDARTCPAPQPRSRQGREVRRRPTEEPPEVRHAQPAKQLRIDNHVGSIEPGKHADLVVWSGTPLSNLSVCEQTWIDGRKYFDREESREQTEKVREMRAVLIQKALASGEKAEKPEEEEPDGTRPVAEGRPVLQVPDCSVGQAPA